MPILLIPKLRHLAVHQKATVCGVQSRSQRSQYFALYRGSKGTRLRMSGMDQCILLIAVRNAYLSFPGGRSWHLTTTWNTASKRLAFPYVLGEQNFLSFTIEFSSTTCQPKCIPTMLLLFIRKSKSCFLFSKQGFSNPSPSHLHASMLSIPASTWASHHLFRRTPKSPGIVNY